MTDMDITVSPTHTHIAVSPTHTHIAVSPNLLTRIAKFIQALLNGTQLKPNQLRELVPFTKAKASGYTKSLDTFVLDTALAYYTNLVSGVPREIDLTDYFSDELESWLFSKEPDQQRVNTQINSLLGFEDITQLATALNPAAKYKKTYLALDTAIADYSENNTRFRWGLVNTANQQQGVANYIGSIRNIVSMHIHGSVVQYYPFAHNRVFILVEELQGQSCLNPTGKNFHVVGDTRPLYFATSTDPELGDDVPTSFDQYTPDFPTERRVAVSSDYRFNDGTYHFLQPITLVDSITIRLHDGVDYIPLPKAQYTNVEITELKFEYFTDDTEDSLEDRPFHGSIKLQLPEDHYITTADPYQLAFFIRKSDQLFSLRIIGFTTTEPELDAKVISYITDNEFTSIKIDSSNTLKINMRKVRPFNGRRRANIVQTVTDLSECVLIGTIVGPVTIELIGHRFFFNIELTYTD